MAKTETITLSVRVKWWARPLVNIASYPGVLLELVSPAAGEWFSDKIAHLIAHHGVTYEVS